MRLPNTAHTSRPWRIHELTRDFRLEDVWALPTPGGPDDFPRLVQLFASLDPSQSSSRAVRTLFAIRWKLGELLGWDGPDAGLGSRVPTLRDRLPADLRDAPSGPDFDALPFTSLYLLDDEWAAEIANRTMHGVMHLGWVPDGTGGYRGQMAVLVKPNGLFGTAYMAAIRPFRHLIVYPPMMREIEREWRARAGDPTPAGRRERPADRRRIPRRPRRRHPRSRRRAARGQKASPAMLPSTRFGGPDMTMSMIHVTWHLTTVAFLTVGSALLLAGSVLDGDTARGIGLLAAGASTGFAALALVLGLPYAIPCDPCSRHPGPAALTAIAALAWWGAL